MWRLSEPCGLLLRSCKEHLAAGPAGTQSGPIGGPSFSEQELKCLEHCVEQLSPSNFLQAPERKEKLRFAKLLAASGSENFHSSHYGGNRIARCKFGRFRCAT